MTTKYDQMKQVQDEVVALVQSPLYEYRISSHYLPVIGEGSHDAHIVFIGEAPGKKEAVTGKPFCGASGKMLDILLQSISFSRENVYITNVVKDRPPENRDPSPEEIELYGPFLEKQLAIIKPKVIATLGRFSYGYIMQMLDRGSTLIPISQAHGKIVPASAPWGSVTIVPLYHPAAAIYNQRLKDTLVADFAVLRQFV